MEWVGVRTLFSGLMVNPKEVNKDIVCATACDRDVSVSATSRRSSRYAVTCKPYRSRKWDKGILSNFVNVRGAEEMPFAKEVKRYDWFWKVN